MKYYAAVYYLHTSRIQSTTEAHGSVNQLSYTGESSNHWCYAVSEADLNESEATVRDCRREENARKTFKIVKAYESVTKEPLNKSCVNA